MSGTSLIQLVFVVLLSMPLSGTANISDDGNERPKLSATDVSLEHDPCNDQIRQSASTTTESWISATLCDLFASLCATLVSTFDLVIGILSYVFLIAGSELANELIK